MSRDNSTKESMLTHGQKKLMDQMTRLLGDQLGQGVDSYGGTVVPDTNATLQSAFDQGGAFGSAERDSALSSLMTPQLTADRYLQGFEENIYRPSQYLHEQGQQRQLAHQYGASGPSGTLQKILADSNSVFNAQMAMQRGDFYKAGLDSEGRERGLALSAAGQSLSEQQASLAAKYQSGEGQRQIEGQKLAEGYANWQMEQPWANPWISQYYASTVGTPAVTQVGRTSTLDMVLGGIGGLTSGPMG